jgi:hypothetical protein
MPKKAQAKNDSTQERKQQTDVLVSRADDTLGADGQLRRFQ